MIETRGDIKYLIQHAPVIRTVAVAALNGYPVNFEELDERAAAAIKYLLFLGQEHRSMYESAEALNLTSDQIFWMHMALVEGGIAFEKADLNRRRNRRKGKGFAKRR